MMPHYRAYTLDRNGRIRAPHNLDCPTDADALEYAADLSGEKEASVEVWQGARRIGRVDAAA